jgi:hypothetical protein
MKTKAAASTRTRAYRAPFSVAFAVFALLATLAIASTAHALPRNWSH